MANILVADDEETIRYAFAAILSDEGHAVTVAASLGEARQWLDQAAFDLVYADILLGDEKGMEILRAVREQCPNCPVVMITGHPTHETASEAVRLGAFDYIPKPVRRNALLDIAKRALDYKALVDEKERYRLHLEAILRSVGDAIITVDRDLVISGMNEAAGELCGLYREAVGKPFGLFKQLFRGDCLELVATAIGEGKASGALRTEWAERVVTMVVSPLKDARAETAGAVLVVKDETRLDRLERDLNERRLFHNLVGQSDGMQRIYSLIETLADVQTTVLVTGETGTGKELVAAALHYQGARRDQPFVRVNCSALPENLLESELFGHVKGAFTGAIQQKTGRFERADGGTIFLDEIGDITPAMQLRLLRVLQEGEFERVGDSSPLRVNVRVVAATNKDLREKVRRGEFRDDLYYRLKVVEIQLPALRERKEDLPLLIRHFLAKFNSRFNKEITAVTAEVRHLLLHYPWPGNVRELEHALEHAFIICNRSVIIVDDLPSEFQESLMAEVSAPEEECGHDREAILDALAKTDWNKAKAARLLGISRQTVYRRISEYHIDA